MTGGVTGGYRWFVGRVVIERMVQTFSGLRGER